MQNASRTDCVLPLLGACLLSAVGSLPLHLAPFVTAALIVDGRASVVGAAWVRVATQLGEFTMAITLPILKIDRISRRSTFFVCLALAVGLALAGSHECGLLLFGWLAIGSCCSVLKHLGVMTASRQKRLSMAISLRLSIVLVISGAVAVAIAILDAPPYDRLLVLLAAACGTFIAAALLLAKDPIRHPSQVIDTPSGIDRSTHISALGLFVILLFFAGTSGVPVFVLFQAAKHGLTFQEVAWSLAATKVIVGVLLLTKFHCGKVKVWFSSLMYGALLLSATVGVHISQDIIALFIALLAWELSVNALSARLQVMVLNAAPESGARWLNLAILIGSSLGPLINGYLISNGQGHFYGILGVVAAFAPAIWVQWSCRRPIVVGRQYGMAQSRLGLGGRRLIPAQPPTFHQS